MIGNIVAALMNSQWQGNYPTGLVGPEDLSAIHSAIKIVQAAFERSDMDYDSSHWHCHVMDVLNYLAEEAAITIPRYPTERSE
jgi:hypothetical protein